MAFRFVLLAVILAITAASAVAQTFEKEINTAVFAHHVELSDVVHNEAAIEAVIQALRLNDVQVANLRSLIDGRSQEVKNLTSEIHDKRLALHRALEQSNAMEVGTLTLSIQELETRVTAINERFQNGFSNMLTPDQRAAFDGIKTAAKQAAAFQMTGLIAPSMVQHDFVIGTPVTKGIVLKKFVEAAETR